jgi:hypothetical protein
MRQKGRNTVPKRDGTGRIACELSHLLSAEAKPVPSKAWSATTERFFLSEDDAAQHESYRWTSDWLWRGLGSHVQTLEQVQVSHDSVGRRFQRGCPGLQRKFVQGLLPCRSWRSVRGWRGSAYALGISAITRRR